MCQLSLLHEDIIFYIVYIMISIQYHGLDSMGFDKLACKHELGASDYSDSSSSPGQSRSCTPGLELCQSFNLSSFSTPFACCLSTFVLPVVATS